MELGFRDLVLLLSEEKTHDTKRKRRLYMMLIYDRALVIRNV
jgi:hypothetical protein